jgi:hypothetical protein
MYGNLKQAAGRVERYVVDAEQALESVPEDKLPCNSVLEWELLMLMSAEFIAFAALIAPLVPETDTRTVIEKFWSQHYLISLVALGVFVAITLPISAGYMWFVQKWPWNMVTWLLVVVSIGSALHIVSVLTDPRGTFVGCISVGTLLLFFSLLRLVNKVIFTGFFVWLLSFIWLAIVYLPICLLNVLHSWSLYIAPVLTAGTVLFVLAELRLMETGTTVGFFPSASDPYTLSVWVNCGVWRFFIQFLTLVIKQTFHGLVWLVSTIWKTFKWCISSMFGLVPTRWWTPTQTVDRLSHVT